jgi:hypothetical protein
MEPEPDLENARRMSRIMTAVVAVMLVLVLAAVYWGACGEDRSVAGERVAPRGADGPTGAPGVAQPILE